VIGWFCAFAENHSRTVVALIGAGPEGAPAAGGFTIAPNLAVAVLAGAANVLRLALLRLTRGEPEAGAFHRRSRCREVEVCKGRQRLAA